MRSVLTDKVAVLVSQGTSSVGNLVLVICVARAETSSNFGVFAIGYSIYFFFLASLRALNGESLLILGRREPDQAVPTRGSCGVSFYAALGASLPLVVLCALMTEYQLVVFAAGLPVLCVVDAFRYHFLYVSSPVKTMSLDLLWAGLQLPISLSLIAIWPNHNAAVLWVAGWIAAAGCALLLAALLGAPKPSWTLGVFWYRRSRHLGLKALAEYVVASGSQQVLVLFLPIVTSLVALAAVRVGQTAA